MTQADMMKEGAGAQFYFICQPIGKATLNTPNPNQEPDRNQFFQWSQCMEIDRCYFGFRGPHKQISPIVFRIESIYYSLCVIG